MKILLTVHTYVPNTDGVQFVTKYLAEGLVKKGHQVHIITYMYPNRSSLEREYINGVKVIRWNVKTVYTIHMGDKKKYQQYILSHQKEYDVMINVGTQTALTDWLFPIFDKIIIPKLLYIHSIWDFKIYNNEMKSLKRLLAKLWANLRWSIYYNRYEKIFKSYNMITQLHLKDYSYRFFKKKYGIESRIIENAAEDEFFSNLPIQNKEHKYIINISNFNARKNQKKCIEYFYESKIPEDWSMILIGSKENAYSEMLKEYEKSLREKKGICGTQKVMILTDISRDEIYQFVKKSSLYLMTSTWEAFPISLIEAMAAGVPYISSDVGIVKYLAGGIVAMNDDEFKTSLERFTTDERIRLEYGKRGMELANKHYRIDDKVNQLENYLYEIIQGGLF